MKQLLTLLCIVLFASNSYGKGCAGFYYISGTAFSADHSILKNETLEVKLGERTFTAVVDSNGRFEIEIPWQNPCRSGGEGPEEAERYNPPFLFISVQGKAIQLENKWKRYNDCFPESKERVTWKQDLNFGL